MLARPSLVRCYCETVFAAACLGVALIAGHLNINFIERRPIAFAVLAGGVLLGEMLPIKVPRGGEDEELTLSSSFALALLVVGGIGPALIAQGAASLLQDRVAGKPFWRQRFNVGQYTLALLFAGAIVSAMTVDTPAATANPIASGQVPAMMLAAGTFFVINSALVGVAVALFRGVPIGRYFRHDPGFLALTGGVMVLVAPVVLATTMYSVVIVPLCLAPALALYKAISRGARSEHAARHDPLTGLPNRAAFREAVAQAVQDGREPGCVLLMDLDRFKEVNDTLGHHTGDVLLAKVAERLLAAAGADGMVARLGGDEFAVVSSAPSLEQAHGLAQRLADSLAAAFELGPTVVDVQASVGIALFPAHGSGIDTLLQKADVAMYRAKELRTAVMAYDERHDQNSPARLSLTAALRTAIQGEEIIVLYRPQLDVRTGEVRAVEALARWRHPERGLIGPASFVGVAERTNLIEPLTNLVIASRWHRWRGGVAGDRPHGGGQHLAPGAGRPSLHRQRARRPPGRRSAARSPQAGGHRGRPDGRSGDRSSGCSSSASAVSRSRSMTSAPATRRWPISPTCRSQRSRSTARSCRGWASARASGSSCTRRSTSPTISGFARSPKGSARAR